MPSSAKACTDPIVGAILSGWRYDISSISPDMRTDYENHLVECLGCRRRQRIARTIDVLLISITSLLVVAFLLAAVLVHRMQLLMELLKDFPAVHMRLHSMPSTLSLYAVVLAGLLLSTIMWILVAVATPVPGFLTEVVTQRLPPDLKQRLARRHA